LFTGFLKTSLLYGFLQVWQALLKYPYLYYNGFATCLSLNPGRSCITGNYIHLIYSTQLHWHLLIRIHRLCYKYISETKGLENISSGCPSGRFTRTALMIMVSITSIIAIGAYIGYLGGANMAGTDSIVESMAAPTASLAGSVLD